MVGSLKFLSTGQTAVPVVTINMKVSNVPASVPYT